jgi:hypothetical protein
MRNFLLYFVAMVIGMPAGAGIVAEGPAKDAPEEILQFGRLVGAWECTGFTRQKDGSWQPNPWLNKWTWYWALGGRAVQDVWEAPPESPAGASTGTNLRIYDPATGKWHMAWTTTLTNRFDLFTATQQGEEMVMEGHIPARGPRPEHFARITFHDIGERSYLWRYEASLSGEPDTWKEQARLDCRRAHAQ